MKTTGKEVPVADLPAVASGPARGGGKVPEAPVLSPYLGWPMPFPPGPYGI